MNDSRDLALLAKVLPHMFARWRHEGDFEILAGLPDGEITIDALTGAARHAVAGPLSLVIAGEIRSGLLDQLARKGIAVSGIMEVGLRVSVDTSKVKTDRDRIVHFDFHIASRIHAEAGLFEAYQVEEHVWHPRIGHGEP